MQEKAVLPLQEAMAAGSGESRVPCAISRQELPALVPRLWEACGPVLGVVPLLGTLMEHSRCPGAEPPGATASPHSTKRTHTRFHSLRFTPNRLLDGSMLGTPYCAPSERPLRLYAQILRESF